MFAVAICASRGVLRSTLAHYDEHADEFVARTAHLDMSAAYLPFLALLPPGGHILDAGCGDELTQLLLSASIARHATRVEVLGSARAGMRTLVE